MYLGNMRRKELMDLCESLEAKNNRLEKRLSQLYDVIIDMDEEIRQLRSELYIAKKGGENDGAKN